MAEAGMENKEVVKAEKVREELEKALEKWFGLEGEKEVSWWYVWDIDNMIVVNEAKLIETCMLRYILELNDPDPHIEDLEKASINEILRTFGYEFEYNFKEFGELTADDIMYYAKKLVCKREMNKIIEEVMKEHGYWEIDNGYRVYAPKEVLLKRKIL